MNKITYQHDRDPDRLLATEKEPIIIVKFPSPQHGWWDGTRTECEFTIDKFASGKKLTRWGSWECNFYFDVNTGKTIEITVLKAILKLKSTIKVPNAEISHEWREAS